MQERPYLAFIRKAHSRMCESVCKSIRFVVYQYTSDSCIVVLQPGTQRDVIKPSLTGYILR